MLKAIMNAGGHADIAGFIMRIASSFRHAHFTYAHIRPTPANYVICQTAVHLFN